MQLVVMRIGPLNDSNSLSCAHQELPTKCEYFSKVGPLCFAYELIFGRAMPADTVIVHH